MALEQSLRRQVRGYGLVSAGQVGQRPGVSREGGKFEKEVGLRSLYGMPPGRPSILAAAVPLSGGPGPQARSRSWRRNGGWESAGPGVCSTARVPPGFKVGPGGAAPKRLDDGGRASKTGIGGSKRVGPTVLR